MIVCVDGIRREKRKRAESEVDKRGKTERRESREEKEIGTTLSKYNWDI